MEYMMQRFPEKAYDVTPCAEAYALICCCISTTVTLELQSEEAVLKRSNCCCQSAQRRPYAQLNVIEQRAQCFGICAAINSDLAPVDEEGNGGIVPGCGCEAEKIRQIVEDLQLRKDGRGNVAQMRQQRFMLDKICKIGVQFPVLLNHYGVEYPPNSATLARLFGDAPPVMKPLAEVAQVAPLPQFGTREYDVSPVAAKICCASRTLTLEPDEAVLTIKQSVTGTEIITKVPYANIENVQSQNTFGCLASLLAGELTQPSPTAPPSPINPGCGCSTGLVEAIREDLQARVDVRGNVGQIKQLEKMMGKYNDLAAQLPLILDKLGADTSYPPTQQTMQQVYGERGPSVSPAIQAPHSSASQAFDTKNYNVRNEIQNIFCLLFSCGLAGCTTHEVVLEPEQVVTTLSNNCMRHIDRQPYAQLGSVDEEVVCCCVTSVNKLSPGTGCCNNAIVNEIASEFQARKVGRGNIAQLRNQENTMIKAIELDIRTDVLLKHQGIAFPPSQDTMVSMYGAAPPTLPSPDATGGQSIHYEASQLLETKHYDITNTCEFIGAYCLKTNLELNDEEAIFRKSGLCGHSTRREPYAQLGSVEPARLCCGTFEIVNTDRNVICPGCGCSKALTQEVARELQHRKVKRGNIAQIQQQENLIMELIKLFVKADLLSRKEGIQYPPSQNTMESVFGAGIELPSAEQPRAPHRPSLILLQVTIPNGLQPGSVFQVNGPSGVFPITVPVGAVPGQVIQVQVPRTTGATEMQPLHQW